MLLTHDQLIIAIRILTHIIIRDILKMFIKDIFYFYEKN